MMVLYSPSSSSLRSNTEAVGDIGVEVGRGEEAAEAMVLAASHPLALFGWERLVTCTLDVAPVKVANGANA